MLNIILSPQSVAEKAYLYVWNSILKCFSLNRNTLQLSIIVNR